ncbi:MAG TPA: SHOCT domain-containing protein [Solirubrobacteraceae bacterium]|nr:SHOCT domain-containing protein [Solirubrobacteraceae bacterium]
MPLRRRPLLRAAAVGGGAYVAGKRHAESQAGQAAQAPPPAAPPASPAEPAAGGMAPDAIERLKELAQLRDQGILTEEEFAAQKAKLLG